MDRFYKCLTDLENINVFCFDLRQYDIDARVLGVVVMANYHGTTFYSEDILIDIDSFCLWEDTRWVVPPETQASQIIKHRGSQMIVEFLIEEGIDLNG